MNVQESPAPTDAREADERRLLASLDTMELVERWEMPMPAASRALLLAEIERRRYRTKSLPPPPPDDAKAEALPTPEQVDRRRMMDSALLLLVLSWMQVAYGAYAVWALRDSGLLPTLVGAGLPWVTAVAFFVLHRSARSRPHPALTIGLMLYIGLQALQIVIGVLLGDPSSVFGGLAWRILILFGLSYGAAASRRRRPGEGAAGSGRAEL